MEQWYTSDSHFGHRKIIDYSSRPFQNEKEMDEALIERWNARVKPSDHITHLGDMAMPKTIKERGKDWFRKLVKSLNGHKRLLLGNHESFDMELYLEAGFEKIYGSHRTEDGLILSHIPLHPTSLSHVRACVHGHIHEHESPVPAVYYDQGTQLLYIKPYVNICVEKTDYSPINKQELEVMVALAGDKAAEVIEQQIRERKNAE